MKKVLIRALPLPMLSQLRANFLKMEGVNIRCVIYSNVEFDTVYSECILIRNNTDKTAAKKIVAHFIDPFQLRVHYLKVMST